MSSNAPLSMPTKYAIGDRVLVVGSVSNRDMVGVVQRVTLLRSPYLLFAKPQLWYTVEFNRVDRQHYREADLAFPPEPGELAA